MPYKKQSFMRRYETELGVSSMITTLVFLVWLSCILTQSEGVEEEIMGEICMTPDDGHGRYSDSFGLIHPSFPEDMELDKGGMPVIQDFNVSQFDAGDIITPDTIAGLWQLHRLPMIRQDNHTIQPESHQTALRAPAIGTGGSIGGYQESMPHCTIDPTAINEPSPLWLLALGYIFILLFTN